MKTDLKQFNDIFNGTFIKFMNDTANIKLAQKNETSFQDNKIITVLLYVSGDFPAKIQINFEKSTADLLINPNITEGDDFVDEIYKLMFPISEMLANSIINATEVNTLKITQPAVFLAANLEIATPTVYSKEIHYSSNIGSFSCSIGIDEDLINDI